MITRLMIFAAVLSAMPAMAQNGRFKEATSAPQPAVSPAPTRGASTSPTRRRGQVRRAAFKGYFQLGALPFELSGFQDAHISDHQQFGLKSNDPDSGEGRINLPLEQYNLPAGLLPAARIGVATSGPVAWGGELAFSGAGSFSALVATLGLDINQRLGPLRIGVPLRVGFVTGSANLGQISVLENYTAPVILRDPDRTFREGDDLSAGVSGGLASAGLSAEFWVNPNFGLKADVSFQQGFFGEDISITATRPLPEGTTEADGVERERTTISGDDLAIVKPDLSGDPVNMDILGGSWGAAVYVGAVWRPRIRVQRR